MGLRVLHIIDSGGLYGAEIMLLGLVKEQIRKGINPVIASIGRPNIPLKPLEVEANKRDLPLKIFRMYPGPNFYGGLDILRYANAIQCDVLHSHGYKGNILLGLIPKRIRRLPIVTTVHGRTSLKGISKLKIYEILDNFCLQFLDSVVLVNKKMYDQKLFEKHNRITTRVIDNGIDEHQVHSATIPNHILHLIEGSRVIGAIGRLSTEKGFIYLIDAFEQLLKTHNNIKLIIIGDGPEKLDLERKINHFNLQKHIHLTGFINNADHILKYFDILAIPSLKEGLPITVLEAMRAGVPIVASAVGGIVDALDDGKCGILVPPCNINKLSQALSSMIDNPIKITHMADLAKRRFRQHYTTERMCNDYTSLYHEITSDKRY